MLTVVLMQLVGIVLMAFLPERAFALFSSITVFMLVFSWVAELISEYRFRSIKRREGKEDELTFKLPLYPYSNFYALAFLGLVMVMMAVMPEYRISYLVTIPWMILLAVLFVLQCKNRNRQTELDSDKNTENLAPAVEDTDPDGTLSGEGHEAMADS